MKEIYGRKDLLRESKFAKDQDRGLALFVYEDGCVPSRKTKEYLESIEDSYEPWFHFVYSVVEDDSTEGDHWSQNTLRLGSLPTFLIFYEGVEVWRAIGSKNELINENLHYFKFKIIHKNEGHDADEDAVNPHTFSQFFENPSASSASKGGVEKVDPFKKKVDTKKLEFQKMCSNINGAGQNFTPLSNSQQAQIQSKKVDDKSIPYGNTFF